MSGRIIYGDARPVMAPVLTAQELAIADLVGLSSGNLVRAEDEEWQTAVATPSAPTVADGAVAVGTSLTNAATGVKISYQFPWGEATLSSAGSATPTAGALLKVSGSPLVPSAPALHTNVYVETAAGSGTYKLWGTTKGSTVMVDSYGAGRLPYADNASGAAVASGAKELTQYNFAQRFLGASAQAKDADVARVVGNGADNIARVDCDGTMIYDLDSATTAVVGDWFGAAKATGNTLTSQTLAAVADESLAVARCVEAGTSVTTLKVKLLSKKNQASR